MRPVVLVLLALVACSERHVPTVDEKNAERIVRGEQFLLKTPQTRTYHLGSGELTAVEVPFTDEFGFIDKQRCIVWRDTEFKTASVTCGQQQDSIDPLSERRKPSASQAASDP